MTTVIAFDPLVPWSVLAALAVLTFTTGVATVWRGLSGWFPRMIGAAVALAALAGPFRQVEDRTPLSDIVIMLEDRSASQSISDREIQTSNAADDLAAALEARDNTEVRRVSVADSPTNGGTQLNTVLANALAEEPQSRIAGVVLLSDGQVHDIDLIPEPPAPTHLLLTGRENDWDRRLIVRNAPAFAIVDEQVNLTLRVEDSGAAPKDAGGVVLDISTNGGDPQRAVAPLGRDMDMSISLPRGGRNVIQFSIPTEEGELTSRNNTALIQINGVRDRLRVLLVSGEPHAGGRTWRNLLKSDSSVDLVHFTILRPPEKEDGVPVNELSLIAFPTRELFLEKIEDFDLIIFDRYKRRGILPLLYLENVVDYVRNGGAVLIAAGPDFAGAESIFRSPLEYIIPAAPTARVIKDRFVPTVTELGLRHPVTSGLEGTWGAWLRQVELAPLEGHVVMSGAEDRPLLILDRVGEGRVALLGSDHAWLWSRGFEGGGPQSNLLRRLAHWMMKEPDLEEEALTAQVAGQRMRIVRRTLADSVGPVTVTNPDGTSVRLPLDRMEPGRFEASHEGPEIGLYRLEEGENHAVVGLGPASPREFEQTIASGELLKPLIHATKGGILSLEKGIPAVRKVREGRLAAGRGWIGIVPRGAFEVHDITRTPLIPAWLALLLSTGLVVGAWLREGRD